MLQLAVPSDRDAVNALARQVHAMHVAWRPDIYEMADELYSEERFDAAVRDRQLYVAKLQDMVVGYVLLPIKQYDWAGMVRRKVMLVNELCVEESCRNQGIGREIMEDVKALARAFRCTDLQLGVYPENDGAVAFYQKCGFMIKSIDMQMKL